MLEAVEELIHFLGAAMYCLVDQNVVQGLDIDLKEDQAIQPSHTGALKGIMVDAVIELCTLQPYYAKWSI